jgi:hypothetical protein
MNMQSNIATNNYSLLIDIMSELLQNHLKQKGKQKEKLNEEELKCSKKQ